MGNGLGEGNDLNMVFPYMKFSKGEEFKLNNKMDFAFKLELARECELELLGRLGGGFVMTS